jgi:hypothetical protein
LQEKRLHKRVRLDMLQANGRLTFATEVKLLDISMSGVSLQADQRLNMGVKYVLQLKDRGGPLSVKGVVVWSRLSGTRLELKGDVIPLYAAGMNFIDLSENKVAGLRSFIADNMTSEIPAGGRKPDVRFHIKAKGKAILNYPADYGVRTIRVDGMLIESDHALEIESTIPLELSLHGTGSVNFLGRIVFCRETERNGMTRYKSGIEFIDLADGDKEIIEAFVDYLATSDKAKV